MATSKWQSSLANIEARLRRGLGIAGPISLALEEPPALTPVVLCDDLTRPGCVGTDYRGRRWALSTSGGSFLVGTFATHWIVAGGLQTTVGNAEKGGIVLDWVEFSWTTAAAANVLTLIKYASPFSAQPGVAIRDGFMVDPIGLPGFPGNYETSPCFAGTAAATAVTAFGNRTWEGACATNAIHRVQLDYFLREQAYIAIGNSVAFTASTGLVITWRGRVF